MSAAVRRVVVVLFGTGVGILLLWGVSGLAPFGHYPGPYGLIINSVAIAQRHVTNVVAAVNFDYRGVDTIMEEFMLFTAVTGIVVLLRRERTESEVEPPTPAKLDTAAASSDAVRALCLVVMAPVFLLGIYIVSHGQLTPGGGFQGGIILVSAFFFIYLAGEYATLRKVGRQERGEIADALGAAGFVIIGFAGLVAGAAFLQNIIPLGPVGVIYSAGTIPLINLSVGLEVMGGLLVIAHVVLSQTLLIRATAEAQQERQAASSQGSHAGAQQREDQPDQPDQADQPDQPDQAQEESAHS